MNSKLFVYGTLLSAARHPMGAKLAREARLIGPASIQGLLYRIGSYPGVIDAPNRQARVHGELYALADPVASLAWLDAYEGITGGSHGDEYARVERQARLRADGEVTAWVYLYQGEPASLGLIADGRWIEATK